MCIELGKKERIPLELQLDEVGASDLFRPYKQYVYSHTVVELWQNPKFSYIAFVSINKACGPKSITGNWHQTFAARNAFLYLGDESLS